MTAYFRSFYMKKERYCDKDSNCFEWKSKFNNQPKEKVSQPHFHYQYLRDVPVGVHDVHVGRLHRRGRGHARVSVTAGVGAKGKMTRRDLEALRRQVVRWVSGKVNCVNRKTVTCHYSRSWGWWVVPTLWGYWMWPTVRRSWNKKKQFNTIFLTMYENQEKNCWPHKLLDNTTSLHRDLIACPPTNWLLDKWFALKC